MPLKKWKKKLKELRFVSNYISLTSLINYYYPALSKDPLQGLKIKGIQYKIFIRRNSATDKMVLKYVFHKKNGWFHMPPSTFQLPGNSTIVDLGSNIGLTIVHFKNQYPSAKVIGYEMDTDNFNLAIKNCGQYKNVFLNNEAVWVKPGSVSYLKEQPNDAFSIDTSEKKGIQKMNKVNSITIAGIIAQYNISKIDYLKMDIEGAEKNIFKENDLSWLNYVDFINMEIHHENEMPLEEYIRILKSNGFNAWKDTRHWSAVLAQRIVV